MRFVVLLCAIWLPGCTHITKASAVMVRAENRFLNDQTRELKDQEWISVSAFIITYPADERLISTRELRRGDRIPTFQQYSQAEFETERSSLLTPDRADEILKFASEHCSMQVTEMPRVRTIVGRPVTVGFGVPASVARSTQPGFLLKLQPQEISHSNAKVKYRVSEFVLHDSSPVDQDEDWDMAGRAELGLGKCYMRTTGSNDDRFNVAVLLRLMSVSQPCREESEET